MSFGDVMTILGLPPLCGVYWGSAVLLRSIWSRRGVPATLERIELAAVSMTALTVPVAVALLPILLCIYA